MSNNHLQNLAQPQGFLPVALLSTVLQQLYYLLMMSPWQITQFF